MTKFISKIILVVAFAPVAAFAQSGGADAPPTAQVPFYIDIFLNAGYGTVQGGGLSSSQNVVTTGGGFTFGFGSTLFAGFLFDYRLINQYSDVNVSDGNFTGNRQFIAPVIGFRGDGFIIKFDYQLDGDYRLTKKTASDTNVIYGATSGWRFGFLIQATGSFYVGANYESVSHKLKNESEQAVVSLSSPLQSSQFGLGVAYVF
jgi:hypothetical protein